MRPMTTIARPGAIIAVSLIPLGASHRQCLGLDTPGLPRRRRGPLLPTAPGGRTVRSSPADPKLEAFEPEAHRHTVNRRPRRATQGRPSGASPVRRRLLGPSPRLPISTPAARSRPGREQSPAALAEAARRR